MQSDKVMDIPNENIQTKANKKTKFIAGGVVIALAVIYLIYTGIQSSAAYYFTVDELYQRPDMIGRQVRVSGLVDTETVDYNHQDLILKFDIMGDESQNLPIVFHGPQPDQMTEGAEAIVEGTFDGSVFTAKTLLLKCPSRYDDSIEETTVQGY